MCNLNRRRLLLKIFILPSLIAFSYTGTSQSPKIEIPLGGNSFITTSAPGGDEEVTDEGWTNWEHSTVIWSTYIRVNKPGTFKLSAVMTCPEGSSKISTKINGKGFVATVTGANEKEYQLGQWTIAKACYIKIDMQGTSKTGSVFAEVSRMYMSGTAVDNNAVFVKNNDDNYFYWGRRGPSCHLRYDISEVDDDIEWFYSELTVPTGMDAIGTYFMANGFAEGYFGMQVNSPTERRVLFSVWSPFETDDPRAIPENQKIKLLRKGDAVQTGEFGNEGSGGQSYIRYNWKAGQTYKFLLKARPVANNYTNYSAWFYATDQQKWIFIASFARPSTQTYLKDLYSFIENFDNTKGHLTRKAWYHNPWIRTTKGDWKSLTNVEFTGDNTAEKKFRMDYSGGVENGRFFLRNCGFFNDYTSLNSLFSVPGPGKKPDMNLADFK